MLLFLPIVGIFSQSLRLINGCTKLLESILKNMAPNVSDEDTNATEYVEMLQK
jgi:hypothetical protein